MDAVEFRNAFQVANSFSELHGWSYIGNDYNERYVLGEKGVNTLICFGINPSTAKPGANDSTIQIVRKVAKQNRCDGWMMLNLYPQRAKNPKEIHKVCHKKLYDNNLAVIGNILESLPNAILWAAWGANIDHRRYLYDVIEDIKKKYPNRRWKQRGPQSKKAHPHHPLYVKSEAILEDFDIENYKINE